MGLKDLKLVPMEQISVPKIQGRTNTRQDCSRVGAPLKENLEVFVFFKACGPLAQATRRSQSKELKFFTKGEDWPAAQPVDALVWPGKAWSDHTSRYVLHNLHFLLKDLDWGTSSRTSRKSRN